jgi:hypothetical protein
LEWLVRFAMLEVDGDTTPQVVEVEKEPALECDGLPSLCYFGLTQIDYF